MTTLLTLLDDATLAPLAGGTGQMIGAFRGGLFDSDPVDRVQTANPTPATPDFVGPCPNPDANGATL